MAKPITPTPTVTGASALKIQQQIQRGTPNTQQRIDQIRRADELVRRVVVRGIPNRG